MWLVLVITGFGWALLGFVGCFMVVTPDTKPDDTAAGLASLMVMVLMVLPGLALGGFGLHMRNRKRNEQSTIDATVREALERERRKS